MGKSIFNFRFTRTESFNDDIQSMMVNSITDIENDEDLNDVNEKVYNIQLIHQILYIGTELPTREEIQET